MFLQQRCKAGFTRFDLCFLGTVAFGELEELFDLVFALFALQSGLVVELRGVRGCLRVGGCLWVSMGGCWWVLREETIRAGVT